MRNSKIPNTKEGHMRLTLNRMLALVAIAAAGLMAGCSADSPGPTTPPPPKTNGLAIVLTANPGTLVQGNCSLITAVATQNGVPVPAGISVLFSTTFGIFAQNGLPTISVVSQNGGIVTTAICSDTVGPSVVTGTVTVGSSTARSSVPVNFTSNGLPNGPFIAQCANPHTGPVTGGTPITITGGNLGTDASKIRVFFRSGGVVHQATGVTVDSTGSTITATTPAFPELAGLPATPVEVDVVLNGQTLASPNCFTYTNESTPVVSAILPSSGTKVGGTRVTITGSGFSAPVQVFFGGTLEAQVISVSQNEIVAITPPANGQGPSQSFPLDVPVTVKEVNCSGSACTSNPVTFTYTVGLAIFGFTPDHGDASTVVTITGQGFVAPLLVTFGGKQGTVISVSGTQILAKPPAGCPSSGGTIAVTLLSTGETASSPGTFTINVPTITSGPTPGSGPGGTATAVSVTGTNLFPTGTPSALTVTAAGGSVGVVSKSEQNAQQTLTFTVTPDICSPTVTLTFINGATGCTTSASFANTTFIESGPTASFSQGTTVLTDPDPFTYTAVFHAVRPTSGTPEYSYAWTFANSDGSPADPATSTSQNTTAVKFTCPDTTPCSGTATLTVTDACSKSASTSAPVTPPAAP